MSGGDLLTMVDFALRASGVTLLLLVGVQFAIRLGGGWIGRLGTLTSVGGAAYLVCPFVDAVTWYFVPVIVFCVINPALLWLLGRALFEDDFEPGLIEWAMPGSLLGLWVLRLVVADTSNADLVVVLQSMHGLIQLSLALHLLWRVWGDRQNDLVEARRRFRRTFVTLGGGLLGIIAVVELAVVEPDDLQWLLLLQVSAVWLLAAWICASLLKLEDLFSVSDPVVQVVTAEDGVDPDTELVLALMTDEKLYLQEGLTVAGLAERAGVPEYRTRQIINTRLGFRNFSDFLNGYRIEDAALRLKDPQMRRLPILTIALDVGFGSIGPFNRAFKDRLGLTPSVYRRQALLGGDGQVEN